MAENSEANGSQGSVALNVGDVGDMDPNVDSGCFVSVPFAQKVIDSPFFYFSLLLTTKTLIQTPKLI